MLDIYEFAEMFRREAGKADAKRDEGLTTPQDVERFDNIVYGQEDTTWQVLDVYRPKNVYGKLPVILIVHGGGWVYGSKELYQFYGCQLAQKGFVVVNYSYRLAPENKYPSSFVDTSLVASFILKEADQYGFDTENIFGVGDSAGAHMLSMYAAGTCNEAYRASLPFSIPEGFHFNAIGLNCGVYQMDRSQDHIMSGFLPDGGTDEEYSEINSVEHINDQYPAVFVMTAPGDFLFAGPESLIPILKEHKIPFMYRVYGSEKEPLYHVFHVNCKEKWGRQANEDTANFFKLYLRP